MTEVSAGDKVMCRSQAVGLARPGSDWRSFVEYLREKGLTDDPNFHLLAIYYNSLREGGDGELLVKLLKGKMSIRGATYLKKVVAFPELRQGGQSTQK